MWRAAPCQAEEILYVGDRMDNDIRPTAEVGMKTALIRRGPRRVAWAGRQASAEEH
jgi:FMN phosphatase YigB (HAD superfamily)